MTIKTISEDVIRVLGKIEKETTPVSIFLYGSRARQDYERDSDYEIGIIFTKETRREREELAKFHQRLDLNIYPFLLSELKEYKIDAPFPKAVFLRDIISTGVTVCGQKIIEDIKLPAIKVSDLIELISFELGYAMSAIHAFRQKDFIAASTEFSKCALYGACALVILNKNIFPLRYDEIYEEVFTLELDNSSKDIIEHAMKVRKGKTIIEKFLYKNITFLNQVYFKVKQELSKEDKILVSGCQL